ncbi:MAG: hypothetical protein Kow00120_23680 [Anaerolineae bacterium]
MRLALLGALVAACAPAPPPTLVDINQTATETARAEFAAPATLVYPGVRFSGLERYRAVLALSFAGTVGGVAKRGSLGLDAVVDMTRPAAQGTVSVGGDAGVFGAFPQVITFGKTYIGGVDYVTGVAATGEANCLAQHVNQFDPLAYNALSPDEFLPPGEAPALAFVTQIQPPEAGRPLWQFRAEGFSTATLVTATLDVWTTTGAAPRVVQIDLQGEGHVPGQSSARGTVTLHYELTELDEPPEITLPPPCAAVTPAPQASEGD